SPVQTSTEQASTEQTSTEKTSHAQTQTSPAQERASQDANQCQRDGQFDSNLLALSWQSSFCELYGKRKAECRALSQTPQASQWRQFALHGLWPNRAQCGSRYGYCGAVKQSPKHFCDYPALPLSSTVRQQLAEVMPSARYGSCLERHEWWKHGTCRTADPNEYFAIAIQLTEELNASAWVQDFIQPHIGKQVTKKELNQEFDKSFGQGAHKKLSLVCAKGLLSEIRLSLPRDLTAEPLAELLGKAGRARNGSCPERFTLDQPN
ncbi:MAG: ribonuclease T2 family protein, partial [Shewanella sp.]